MGRPSWAVAARLVTPLGPVDVGTGLAGSDADRRPRRAASFASTARPNRAPAPLPSTSRWSGSRQPWTGSSPARPRTAVAFSIDSLPASIRAIARCSGSSSGRCSSATGCWRTTCATARGSTDFERIMADAGVAIAAARAVAVAELSTAIGARRDAGIGTIFPWAELALVGTLEAGLVERARHRRRGQLRRMLGRERERDRAAGRTLEGPHRSDLMVGHGPKEMPAKVCSTGEQKALLIGLVLAHCDLVGRRRDGARAPPAARRDHRPPRSRAAGRAVRGDCRLGQSSLDVRHRSGRLLGARGSGPILARRGGSRRAFVE